MAWQSAVTVAIVNDDLRTLRTLLLPKHNSKIKKLTGMTPLMVAAIHRKPEATAMLLKAGANVNVRAPALWAQLRAIDFAVAGGCAKTVDVLLRTNGGPMPGEFARKEIIERDVELILRVHEGGTPAELLSYYRGNPRPRAEVVRRLLGRGKVKGGGVPRELWNLCTWSQWRHWTFSADSRRLVHTLHLVAARKKFSYDVCSLILQLMFLT